MGTEIGTPDPGLSQSPIASELEHDACSFEFFQAVALLQRLRDDLRPVGGFSSPGDEVVRFSANPHLGFPASQIQDLTLKDEGPAEMRVNFMGLTGPMGILPHTYSELILERQRAKDRTLASFFDIFNNRAIALFYRAWQRCRFPVTYAAGQRDSFTQYLLDLLGLGTPELRDRQDIEDEALMHYIALLMPQSRSAASMEQLIGDYFEVPVDVQQFTGNWYTLDRQTQCSLDEESGFSNQLALGAVVGDALWDRQSSVRIRLGPLTLERYEEFLPQGRAYKELKSIVRFFSNDCLDFELQLVLDRSEVPSIELDLNSSKPARLGWVSWAKTVVPTGDPDHAILAL